jgi:hypothetical protein
MFLFLCHVKNHSNIHVFPGQVFIRVVGKIGYDPLYINVSQNVSDEFVVRAHP